MDNDLATNPNATSPSATASELNRAATFQLLIFVLLSIGAIVALMFLLNWAAQSTGSSSSDVKAIDVANRSISVILLQEPPQLDSSRATDTTSGQVLGHVMEGLLHYDSDNTLVPGVAERWDIRPDGATFWLRKNAKWSDGEPVTAHDFKFAWQTALKPSTASEYAFILYPIKNGEKISRGELAVDQLGVTVVNDFELKIEFEQPIAYFDKLVAFATYYPIRQDFYEKTQGRFGADADQLLYNGPFVLDQWVHNASMRLEKNPYYWDKDSIYLNTIHVPFITSDKQTAVNLFKDGRIADTELDAETLPDALRQGWYIKRFQEGTVFYVEFNHREGRLTRNLKLRRAMQLALDPSELVYKVIKVPGYLPGVSLFPSWIKGHEKAFREEYIAPARVYDPERARELLEEARIELGIERWPTFSMLSGDTPISIKQTEYYQSILKQNLGLNVTIDRQIFKQRLAKMTAGEFDLVLAGWGPDFDDPITFGDLFASWNLNNRGRYANAELDQFVRTAQGSIDPVVRMRALGGVQNILHDQAVILPDFERGKVFVSDPRMQNMTRRSIGPDPDYSRVRLVENP